MEDVQWAFLTGGSVPDIHIRPRTMSCREFVDYWPPSLSDNNFSTFATSYCRACHENHIFSRTPTLSNPDRVLETIHYSRCPSVLCGNGQHRCRSPSADVVNSTKVMILPPVESYQVYKSAPNLQSLASRRQIPYITFVNSKPIELPPERPTTFAKHVVFRRQLQSSTTRGHGDDGESVGSSRRSAILAGHPSPNEKLDSAKDSGIDVELLSPHKSPYGNRVTFADSDILDGTLTKSASQSRSGRASTEVGGDIPDRPANPDGDWLSADDGVEAGISDVEADPLDRIVSASSAKLSSHESDYVAASVVSRQTSSGYRHRFSVSERGDATPAKDEGVFSASTRLSRPSRGGSAGSLLSEVTPIETPVERRSSVPVLPDVTSGLTKKRQAKKKKVPTATLR